MMWQAYFRLATSLLLSTKKNISKRLRPLRPKKFKERALGQGLSLPANQLFYNNGKQKTTDNWRVCTTLWCNSQDITSL